MKRKEAHSKMSIRGNQSTKEHISGQMDAREKSLLCVELARRRRAKDVVVLDLKGLVAFTDYFVICTGRSDRQVQAIVQHLEEELRMYRVRPRSIEGFSKGQWVLMDYNDVIVHIFQKPIREFYDLEGLWSDAPAVQLPPDVEEDMEQSLPKD
jgi:ribosome-associated protein